MRLPILLLCASALYAQPSYDLLLKGAHVIDPKNKISALRDVAIKDRHIAAVEPNIPAAKARKVVNVAGLYLTPGLIDLHAHVFAGSEGRSLAGGEASIFPDAFALRVGVTTVVDAGSSGRSNFEYFKKTVIDRARTRVLALLNVGAAGMPGEADEQRLDLIDAKAAADLAKAHPDTIVGFKVAHYRGADWTPVERGVEAGTLANLPVMIDFGQFRPERPFQDLVLKKLRPGDIYTHCFYAPVPMLDDKGKLMPYLFEARKRGVLFDVGHGGAAFEFRQAVPAVKQGFPPDTISTDVHSGSLNSGMKDQLNVMSKFLNMGMTLDDIIFRSTWNPAKVIHREQIGHLSVGAIADIAVLRVEKGQFAFVDSYGARMDGTQRLVNELTVASGLVVYDLNGRTRDRWDGLGKYEGLGEPWWDGTRGGSRALPLSTPKPTAQYSPLKQINRSNVAKLAKAWQFDTGEEFKGSEIQCRPIVIDGVLYGTTPKLRVIALDAATGKLLWSFDPFFGKPVTNKQRNRGLMQWGDRLYVGAGTFLYAIDRKTGKLIEEFGANGRIDLRENLGRDPETQRVTNTSPGVVYKDSLIVGFLTSEGLPSSPGDIRSYDARTGKLRWSFHTIPHPGEPGYETWPADGWKTLGGANSWPGMALDEKRGLVFVPTGSAAFDFYGGNRHGDNLYANSLIALNAETGKHVWHFQFVKHDVWDRDLPTAPVLVTVKRNGRSIDAVAQCTKSGHAWIFNRETGESLFPFETVRTPPSPADGELLATTQVLPLKPAPFARQEVTEALLTTRTPEAHADALKRYRSYRSGPQFTPPSFEGTFVFPGFDGGAEWGGQAYDPETGLLYINSNEMAWVLRLIPQGDGTRKSTAAQVYTRNCSGCHREDRKGTPPEFPALLNLEGKNVEEVIRKGAGRMPGFAFLGDDGVRALTAFLRTGDNKEIELPAPRQSREVQLKYRTDGYNKFLDKDGYPAIKPPWGTLNALNVSTGEYAWQIPFGEFPELAAKGMKNTGTENYGGAVATAGGLLFIGATNHDRKFHVFDKITGELLWETTLPAAGNATPVVYEVNGKQYVAIAAGGGKSGAPSGGSYVAFALP